MNERPPSIDEIARDLGALARPTLSDGSLRGATHSAVLRRVVEVEGLGRLIDAARIAVAGELGERSRAELGDAGLARSENFPTAAKLLAATAGLSVREARGRIELGCRMRAPELLGGAAGAEPFPAVTAALGQGRLGVETAGVIVRECSGLIRRGISPAHVAEAEESLVRAAAGLLGAGHQAEPGSPTGADALPAGADALLTGADALSPASDASPTDVDGSPIDALYRSGVFTVDDVARLAVRVRDHLDPDGTVPREERQRELRGMTLSRCHDGMYRGKLALTPEQGAVWMSATQSLLSPRVAPRFTSEHEAQREAVLADPRTNAQRLVDAATELITRAAAQPELPRVNGATPTINVHVTLADLESGRGAAWADGLDDPVPVSAVEQLRCHATTITTVFGDQGEVLHHGKARRLFSHAQNRALAARDGGCVWPGCDRPPSWCETHHAEPWRSPDHPPGRTDIDNGVLLCQFHHSHLHTSSWTLAMLHGTPPHRAAPLARHRPDAHPHHAAPHRTRHGPRARAFPDQQPRDQRPAQQPPHEHRPANHRSTDQPLRIRPPADEPSPQQLAA